MPSLHTAGNLPSQYHSRLPNSPFPQLPQEEEDPPLESWAHASPVTRRGALYYRGDCSTPAPKPLALELRPLVQELAAGGEQLAA